jgi:hypothetical protein
MLSVILLGVAMLSVVMLNVVAPFVTISHFHPIIMVWRGYLLDSTPTNIGLGKKTEGEKMWYTVEQN